MMMTQSLTRILVLIVTILATGGALSAQQPSTTRPPDPAASPQQQAAGFKAPEDIDFRTANIISEGVRLHAELFSLIMKIRVPVTPGWAG